MMTHEADRRQLLEVGDVRGEQSLPILRDWQEWWSVWGPRIAQDVGKQPWILFLLDSQERVLKVQTTLSRIVRSKPEWDTRGWSEDEWTNIADVTERALRWFECNVPGDVPEYAAFILTAQRGMFQTMVRLGRELRNLQETGYNTVVVQTDNAYAPVVIKGGDALLKEIEA